MTLKGRANTTIPQMPETPRGLLLKGTKKMSNTHILARNLCQVCLYKEDLLYYLQLLAEGDAESVAEYLATGY